MATNEQVQNYYDALINSYDVLVEAISKASDRGLKISQQFAADVAKGQRETLELGKKLAGEPTDLGQFYASILEATTNAQGRALAFTQAAYQEALGAGAETRETMEKLVAANREAAKAAVKVAQTWSTANPFTDTFRKNFEAFAPQAPKAKKTAEKAAV